MAPAGVIHTAPEATSKDWMTIQSFMFPTRMRSHTRGGADLPT